VSGTETRDGAAPLRLAAADEADLEVVSGVLQDAIVPIGDMTFRPERREFVFVANRYRWEAEAARERVNAGVTFSNVVAVRRRGIDFRTRDRFLDLLAVTCEADGEPGRPVVELTFAGERAIRLETAGLLCHLEDFGEPWPTQWQPEHADD
jgi:hypothetical protein